MHESHRQDLAENLKRVQVENSSLREELSRSKIAESKSEARCQHLLRKFIFGQFSIHYKTSSLLISVLTNEGQQ